MTAETVADRLPVHGFVLAGGKSSRMGRDKATLAFRGQPMIEIAVATLQHVCARVSIAGNREDLTPFAPVIPEEVHDAGPIAGLQAGLRAASASWAMFIPVDVPLLRHRLLAAWGRAVLSREREGTRLSYLSLEQEPHPAICLLHRDCLRPLSAAVDRGVRRLDRLFCEISRDLQVASAAEPLWIAAAEKCLPGSELDRERLRRSFANVNSPEDLETTERQSPAEAIIGTETGKQVIIG